MTRLRTEVSRARELALVSVLDVIDSMSYPDPVKIREWIVEEIKRLRRLDENADQDYSDRRDAV